MDFGFVQEEENWPEAEDDSWMLGAGGQGTMRYACGDYERLSFFPSDFVPRHRQEQKTRKG